MPFFNAWEFGGKFPDILTDPWSASRRATCTRTRGACSSRIIRERWLTARGVIGLFPRTASMTTTSRCTRRIAHARAHAPAFPAPAEGQAGRPAALRARGLHRAEGFGASRLHRRLRGDRRHRHRAAPRASSSSARRLSSIMLKALADRLAEAFAERCTSACVASSGATRPRSAETTTS